MRALSLVAIELNKSQILPTVYINGLRSIVDTGTHREILIIVNIL